MASALKIIFAALSVAIVSQSPALAQWRDGPSRGLFGERELGAPLKPRQSRFSSGLERGPSGNFVGRTNVDRGTVFRAKAPVQPQAAPLIPPEAYNLEPEMVPGYLAEQARRLAETQAQAQAQPEVPPPVQPLPPQPEQPLPGMPAAEPGLAAPQPGLPGPSREQLQSSPDRWFRGGAGATQPAQAAPPAQPGQPGAAPPLTAPPPLERFYMPRPTLGPAGAAGPTAVRGPAAASATSLGAKITRQLGARARSPISTFYQGGTVTLQGRVATSEDRVVAEQMARFEPGVDAVVNQLSVESAQPAP